VNDADRFDAMLGIGAQAFCDQFGIDAASPVWRLRQNLIGCLPSDDLDTQA
jgi:hypothetical protein